MFEMHRNSNFEQIPSLIKLSFGISLLGFLLFGFALYQLLPSVDLSSQSLRIVAPFLGASLILTSLGCLGLVATTDLSMGDLIWPQNTISKAQQRGKPISSILLIVPTCFFISLVLSFVVAKFKLFQLYYPAVWSDTYSYIRSASHPLDSLSFWAGGRPFMVPLIYKAFGISQASKLKSIVFLESLTRFQVTFSCVAWLFFAWSFTMMFRKPVTKLIGFALLIGFSLSLDISQWDRILLSESYSLSLLVIVLGTLVLICESQAIGRSGRNMLRTLLIVTCVGYSFTRDANSYFILSLGFLIAISIIYNAVIYRRVSLSRVAFSMFLLLVFIFQTWTAKHGSRWQGPFLNILHDRILPSDSARQYFTDRGMPLESLPSELYSTDRQTFVRTANQYPQLLEWIDDNGRSAYLSYLIANVSSSLTATARQLPEMVSSQSRYFYASVRLSYPSWSSLISSLLYPHSLLFVLLSSLVGSLALLGLSLFQSIKLHQLLPVAIFVTSIPLALVIFHGDSIELSRHAIQVAVQLRLSFITSSLLVIDLALNSRS